jgi:hypothetical protein
MTPPDAEKPLSAEELDALEAMFGDWLARRMSGAPCPPGIATINALPRLLATARSANLAYAKGRGEGLEAAARWVRLGRWHDPDSCAKAIRALKDAPQSGEGE